MNMIMWISVRIIWIAKYIYQHLHKLITFTISIIFTALAESLKYNHSSFYTGVLPLHLITAGTFPAPIFFRWRLIDFRWLLTASFILSILDSVDRLVLSSTFSSQPSMIDVPTVNRRTKEIRSTRSSERKCKWTGTIFRAVISSLALDDELIPPSVLSSKYNLKHRK